MSAPDSLPAGRELDALVAEKVMGLRFWKEKRGDYALCVGQREGGKEPWTGVRNPEPQRYTEVSASLAATIGFFGEGIKPYSTDIAAAWTVVKKLQGWTDPVVHVSVVVLPHAGGSSFCSIESMRRGEVLGKDTWIASAKEAPEAICRAALKAVGHG